MSAKKNQQASMSAKILLTYLEADLSLWRLVFYFQIWYGGFHPLLKGCLLDCLDWVPNRVACIDACFVWWCDT